MTTEGVKESPRGLDSFIASLGMTAYRHPWMTVLVVLAGVGLLASQLPKIEFVMDVDRYLRTDDPVRMDYDALRDQFGRDEIILIALEPPRVFDLDFLTKLHTLHQRLEDELPWLGEVQSLINARQTRGVGDSLLVDELLEEWPANAEDVEVLRRTAIANPFYRNLYLSEDGSTTGIVVRPLTHQSGVEDPDDVLSGFSEASDELSEAPAPSYLTGAQLSEVVAGVRRIVSETDLPETRTAIAGVAVMNEEIQRQTLDDMVLFSSCAFGIVAFLLSAVFRRVSAVLLPMGVVFASVVVTLGAMAALGRPVTFLSQVVPSFILAVGVGFVVHLLAIFFQRFDRGDTEVAAVEHALHHAGPAIAMSGLTTASGMMSFLPSELVPIRDVGAFVPFGVLVSASLSLVLVPALIALLPMRARAIGPDHELATERILIACGRFAVRHARAVAGLSLLVVLIAAAGIPRIVREYNPLEWLPEDNTVRLDQSMIDSALGGSTSLELVIDTGRENGLYEPEVLRRFEAIQAYAEEHPSDHFAFRKTLSVADIVKEIHQALHEGRPEAYAISDDGRLVAQELLLFENSGNDDLEDVVDSGFRLARVTLKGEHADGKHYAEYVEEHRDAFGELMGELDLSYTGFFTMASHVAMLIVETAIYSYALAFALITPLMILFMRSVRTGILSMAPNLSPILITLGVMGWAGIAMDVFTILIAGIALGLVVDDTLHILNGFRREFARSQDVERAVAETMRTTGRALLFTTLVLTSAFGIYGLASAATVVHFGLLTALAVALAFVFDVLLSPALIALVYGDRRAG
ncbi:MAG: hypothetical protein CL908_24505 [Deltaproteobacteria bacterium]|nr:hypothetical protein [Deltaproteobacteria bacterium]